MWIKILLIFWVDVIEKEFFSNFNINICLGMLYFLIFLNVFWDNIWYRIYVYLKIFFNWSLILKLLNYKKLKENDLFFFRVVFV